MRQCKRFEKNPGKPLFQTSFLGQLNDRYTILICHRLTVVLSLKYLCYLANLHTFCIVPSKLAFCLTVCEFESGFLLLFFIASSQPWFFVGFLFKECLHIVIQVKKFPLFGVVRLQRQRLNDGHKRSCLEKQSSMQMYVTAVA